MTYAHNNIKLTFGGYTFGDEIWANSLTIGTVSNDLTFPADQNMQNFVAGLATVVQSWFTSNSAKIYIRASLNWVKIALVDKEGKYIDGPYIHDFDVPSQGPGTDPVAPQLTVAHSMTTAVKRGPGRFGRIYPPLNAQVDGNGRAIGADLMAQAFSDFIEGINDYIHGAGPAFVEASVVVASAVGTGINAPVTGVRVGDVIDTMRSRRSALKETYSVRTVDNSGFDGGESGGF